MAGIDSSFAAQNFHSLFAKEADLPERLLSADPDSFLGRALARMMGKRGGDRTRSAGRLSHCLPRPRRTTLSARITGRPWTRFQAGAADRVAGRKLSRPVLVLGPRLLRCRAGPTPVEKWRSWAEDAAGGPTCGVHLQLEDAPDEVLPALRPSLSRQSNTSRA